MPFVWEDILGSPLPYAMCPQQPPGGGPELAGKELSDQLNEIVDSYGLLASQRTHVNRYRVETTTPGDEIVRSLYAQLDQFGLTRHEYQQRFHEQFVHSCLPKIYGDEWDTNSERILHRYHLQAIHQETLIVCPRRFGKTTAVAMFAAAFLWCVPSCEIAIFSTGKRTAGKLMAQTLAFLDMIRNFRSRVETKNQELIVLKFGPGDERKLNCYPGTISVRFQFFFSELSYLFLIVLTTTSCFAVG